MRMKKGPPRQKRKRDGPGSCPGGGGATNMAADGAEELTERRPAKRRVPRQAGTAMVEGPLRRSARIACRGRASKHRMIK